MMAAATIRIAASTSRFRLSSPAAPAAIGISPRAKSLGSGLSSTSPTHTSRSPRPHYACVATTPATKKTVPCKKPSDIHKTP